MENRNDLMEHYFNLGYEQKEILSCLLLIYDENLSSRQLRRILLYLVGVLFPRQFQDLDMVVLTVT